MLAQDQRMIWIARHVPFLLYGWMTQKRFPTLASIEKNPDIFSDQDKEIFQKITESLQTGEVSLISI